MWTAAPSRMIAGRLGESMTRRGRSRPSPGASARPSAASTAPLQRDDRLVPTKIRRGRSPTASRRARTRPVRSSARGRRRPLAAAALSPSSGRVGRSHDLRRVGPSAAPTPTLAVMAFVTVDRNEPTAAITASAASSFAGARGVLQQDRVRRRPTCQQVARQSLGQPVGDRRSRWSPMSYRPVVDGSVVEIDGRRPPASSLAAFPDRQTQYCPTAR
jgi:hypothetical protein